jgi:hypothetical protein
MATNNKEGMTDPLSLRCRLALGYVQKTGFMLSSCIVKLFFLTDLKGKEGRKEGGREEGRKEGYAAG